MRPSHEIFLPITELYLKRAIKLKPRNSEGTQLTKLALHKRRGDGTPWGLPKLLRPNTHKEGAPERQEPARPPSKRRRTRKDTLAGMLRDGPETPRLTPSNPDGSSVTSEASWEKGPRRMISRFEK